MHKTTLISIALLLVTAIACKKENNTPKTLTTIPTDTSGYFRIQENIFISTFGGINKFDGKTLGSKREILFLAVDIPPQVLL